VAQIILTLIHQILLNKYISSNSVYLIDQILNITHESIPNIAAYHRHSKNV